MVGSACARRATGSGSRPDAHRLVAAPVRPAGGSGRRVCRTGRTGPRPASGRVSLGQALQTGFRWAWITLLVMILLKSVNVVPAVIFGSGLIPQMLALYEIATIVLLAAVAFTLGLSGTGLRQALRGEAHDSPGVPAGRRRARGPGWVGTPPLLAPGGGP